MTPMEPQSPAAPARGRAWFDLACAAFKRSFPNLVSQVPWDPFYVCPVCLDAFSEEALAVGILTREHAPPESVGGRRVALTCWDCNVGAGHEIDSHMRREADLVDFASGDLKKIKAGLRTESGSVPIQLSASDRTLQMVGVPEATHPQLRANVIADFQSAKVGEDWRDVTFQIEFPSFSPKRARASWLRSAYLVFFAVLGYKFVFRPELEPVRQRIKNPEGNEGPSAFRLILDQAVDEPLLMRIEEPEELRSYAMFYGRNAVFLPRYNDHDLYARLAEHQPLTANFSGKQYPWPVGGPMFLDDR